MKIIAPKMMLIVARVMMKLWSPERDDDDAVERAEQRAERQPARDGGRPVHPRALHEPAAEHRRRDADGAHCEVQAAGHDDDHHGEADHDVDRRGPAQREEAELRQERGRQAREDDREHHDQHDQPELVAEEEPLERPHRPGRSGARPGAVSAESWSVSDILFWNPKPAR